MSFYVYDTPAQRLSGRHFDFVDDETNDIALRQLQASESLLMGRNTYNVYAAAWPGRPSSSR